MQISSQLGSVLGSAVALAVLAGCSTPGTGTMSPNVPQAENVARFASRERLVPGAAVAFVSDFRNAVVYLLNSHGTIKSTLTGFYAPEGLAVDKAGNLYVADLTSSVKVFAPPYNGSPSIINDPGERATGVAVDANGNVAVCASTSASSGPGDLALYSAGATNPTNTLSNGSFSPLNCTFDASGNVFLDGYGESSALVGEVRGGVSGKSIQILSTGNTISDPGTIQVAKSGRVAILDASDNPQIYTYNPPTHKKLGLPVAFTNLADSLAVAFSFTPAKGFVLVASAVENRHGTSAVDLYKYPAGGSPVNSLLLTKGSFQPYPDGIAIIPRS